jgi:hypothetical protein
MTTILESCWAQQAPQDPPVVIRLLEMLRHFDDHDAAGCQWALSLLTCLWQAGGHNRPARTPSLFLVNGTPGMPEDTPDPILAPLFDAMSYDPAKPVYPNVDKASDDYRLMKEGIEWIEQFKSNGVPVLDSQAAWWERSRLAVFGDKRRVPFAQRLHPPFGVITPATNFQVASVTTTGDFKAFVGHLNSGDDALDPFRPRGVDGYQWLAKDTPLIGSIPVSAMDSTWLLPMLEQSSPLLLAPYGSFPETPLPYAAEFKELVSLFTLDVDAPYGQRPYPREAPILSSERYAPYEDRIQRRLRNLPLRYSQFVVNTIDGMRAVLLRLVGWLRRQHVAEAPWIELWQQLDIRALRGIAMGLDLLTFYGQGIEVPRVQPQQWAKVVNTVRDRSTPITRRDLQRAVSGLNKEELSFTLDCLEADGLVRLDGKHVCDIGLQEFVAMLGTHPGFPAPPPPLKHWKQSQYFRKGSAKRRG